MKCFHSVLGVLLFLTLVLRADDFTTLDGDRYAHAIIKRVEPDGLVIFYADGVAKLKFKNLPSSIAVKYGYNPTAEAEFLASQHSNDVAHYQQALKTQGVIEPIQGQESSTSESTVVRTNQSLAANTQPSDESFYKRGLKLFSDYSENIRISGINFLHLYCSWAFSTPTTTQVPPPIADSVEYNNFSKYIVIIRGDHGNGVEGRGTGFLAHYNNKIYLFTNIHVLDECTNVSCQTISGKQLELGLLYLSKNYDLAAIELPNETDGIELPQKPDKPLSIFDEIMILGNSNGDGVVTFLKGKISSIGPDLIETDAKFISGNSGSPLIDKRSHKAIGIATFSVLHKANTFGSDSKFNNTERRFAYRLDNLPSWEQTTYPVFFNQSEYVKRIDARTDDLWNIANSFQNNRIYYISLKSADNRVENIVNKFREEIRFLGSNSSKEDLASAQIRFLRSLILSCEDDLSSQVTLSEWHTKKLLEYREIRTLLREYFLRIKKDVESNNVLY